MIGMCLGDAGGNGANTDLCDQLDADIGLRVGVFQVMDQLRQVFNGINIVMRWRRNQANTGFCEAQLRDHVIDLVAGQLTAFARLGPLSDFNLNNLVVYEVFRSNTKPPGSNLLDLRTALGAVSRRILAAFTGGTVRIVFNDTLAHLHLDERDLTTREDTELFERLVEFMGRNVNVLFLALVLDHDNALVLTSCHERVPHERISSHGHFELVLRVNMQCLLEGVPAALDVHSDVKINLEADQCTFEVSHARLEIGLRELHPLSVLRSTRSSWQVGQWQLVGHGLRLLRHGRSASHLLLVGGNGRVDKVELLHLGRVALHARHDLASLLLRRVRNLGTNLLVQDDTSLLKVLLVEDESLQLLRLALSVDIERDDVVRVVDVVGVLLRVDLRLVVLDMRFFTTVVDCRLLIATIDSLLFLVVLFSTFNLSLALLISFTVAVLGTSFLGRLASLIDRLDVGIPQQQLHFG